MTFNEWWNADNLTSDNPYEPDSAAYWAWEGWRAGALAERERVWTGKDWGETGEWIRQQERERCAKVLEAGVLGHSECAAAIRGMK